MADKKPAIFIATPTVDNKFHSAYMGGLIDCVEAFRDRYNVANTLGSFLPMARDRLTLLFLNSNATHMMCVDSDIGFSAADVQKLLDTGKDFVSGVYCRKQPDRQIPAELTGESDGDLLGAKYVPAGFLQLSRSCVERMYGAYRNQTYPTPWGRATALWSTFANKENNLGAEDISFCRRWTLLDGKIWIHPGVILSHYGEHCYVPEGELRFS